jgi:hypothetical protein
MEFCILSPIAGLERYSTLSKTHLLLPQLRTNGAYIRFYSERRQEDDFIICDNGAYEGHSDWQALIECIRFFEPQVAVLPDYLLQHWNKTWRAASEFLDKYYYELNYGNIKWMFVPQAVEGDIVGFIEGLFRALDDERITWIGLPRALTYAITNDIYMRVRVAEQIRKRSNVKIHALGMAKGSLKELNALNKIACVSSIDSNAPVWRGWCNHYMKSTMLWDEIPVNYEDTNLNWQQNEDETILSNLELCNVNVDSLRSGIAAQRETAPSGEDRKL